MLICYIYLSLDLYTSLHTLGWPLAFIINPQSYYVSTRVSEELRSQIESIKLKQTNKLVLKGIPIEKNENKEILASHIKASLDDVEETKDVSDNISDMHRTGRGYFNKHGYDYQDVTVTLKNNHTKKQIYQNRKKFIKFKIVPYATMKRKRILEECKEIAEDPIYNKICDLWTL